MTQLTKEEAKIQMELLKLDQRRVREEIEALVAQFCKRGVEDDHYFRKLWVPTEAGSKLFRVVGYACVLCGVQKPLEFHNQLCPICNENLPKLTGFETEEDMASCVYCGFNNLSNFVGIPFQKIPEEDRVISLFG